MEFVTLNTGAKMPLEGFGVFQVPDAAVCEQAVYDAIRTGYRLIDTAQAYMNETAVGKAVRRAITLMKEYGIVPQAWGPLAEGRHGIFTHPVLTEIGAKYGKTAAQIALKWNAQRGVSILPKSVHVERMEQNFDIWDFTLSDEDMHKIAELDLGHSEIVDHSDPAFVKMINGFKI